MNGNRLLVVEDDALSRAALRSFFSRQGWEVAVAGTVAEALTLLDPPPACLVLDLVLPDGSGEVVLQAVRNRRLKTRTAVCSGTTDPVQVASVMKLNPDVLLAKPFDLGPILHLCEASSHAH